MKTKILSRRTVLKAAGVSIALPLLEAMVPYNKAMAQMVTGGVRTLFFYKPNGLVRNAFGPVNGGPGGIYAPFAEHLSYVSMIMNLKQPPDGVTYSDGHAPGIARYLTGAQFNPSRSNIRNERTLDWVIGDARGRAPHFLGPNQFKRIRHRLLSDEYFNYVSWRGPRAAQPTQDPRDFFKALFGDKQPGGDTQLAERARKNRKSVLDFVRTEASRLIASVGRDDRLKVEEYLQGVREAEKAAEETGADMQVCMADTGDPVTPENYEKWVETMLDLIYRGIQCDSQQVCTLQFGPEVGGQRVLNLIGMHSLSHYEENAGNYKSGSGRSKRGDYIKNCTWFSQVMADFAGRLKNTVEGDGKNLLDKSLILYGAGLGDSQRHQRNDPTAVLIGRANGALSPKGGYVDAKGARHANLLLKVAKAAGLNINKFGSSTGVLPGV